MPVAIQTVLGAVPPSQLGHCQCHEHIYLEKGKSYEVHPALCMDDWQKSLQELVLYRQAGGQAMVDCQPIGCGRNAQILLELSRCSGVRIVASTGFHKLVFYPNNHWLHQMQEPQLARLFAEELTLGMRQGSDNALSAALVGAKAGLIKTALDNENLSPRYQKLFGAAAAAACQTGAPLLVHIEKDSSPLALLDFLVRHGVAPNRLIFCHMDRAIPDLAVHCEIARQGAMLEYDTIARSKYHSDKHEIALLHQMLAHGFEQQLLLSLDTTRERLTSYGGTPGLAYLLQDFRQMLLQSGICETTYHQIMHKNPAVVLAF